VCRIRASPHSCSRAARQIPLPRHASGIASSHLPQATCRFCRSASSPHNVRSPASGQYYVGVWPLPFRAIVESVFCGSLVTADPFNLRARAAFAFFGVAIGVGFLISRRLASTGVTAESRCIFLDASTVARCRFAAAISSTHIVISLVADRTLNSRTGRFSILTSLSISSCSICSEKHSNSRNNAT
jgi:hypothetical protein